MESSGYFEVGGFSLYASMHVPDGVAPRGGVLFVLPFGEERKSTVRLFVRMARALQKRALAAFLFDLSGTGESGGEHRDSTLARWRFEVAAALDRAAAQVGGEWAVIGARLGANLAVQAGQRAQRLILIEPLLDGEQFLRELQRKKQIKEMLSTGGAQSSEQEMEAAWARGDDVDFDGFAVGAELAAELRSLRLDLDLAVIDTNTPVHICRVGSSTKVSAAWNTVFSAVSSHRDGTALTVRDKPFWGQLEYYESEVLIDEILRYAV